MLRSRVARSRRPAPSSLPQSLGVPQPADRARRVDPLAVGADRDVAHPPGDARVAVGLPAQRGGRADRQPQLRRRRHRGRSATGPARPRAAAAVVVQARRRAAPRRPRSAPPSASRVTPGQSPRDARSRLRLGARGPLVAAHGALRRPVLGRAGRRGSSPRAARRRGRAAARTASRRGSRRRASRAGRRGYVRTCALAERGDRRQPHLARIDQHWADADRRHEPVEPGPRTTRARAGPAGAASTPLVTCDRQAGQHQQRHAAVGPRAAAARSSSAPHVRVADRRRGPAPVGVVPHGSRWPRCRAGLAGQLAHRAVDQVQTAE